MINQYEVLDQTQQGQLILNVTSNLITAVEDYLAKINRLDYLKIIMIGKFI